MSQADDRYYVPHGSHWPIVGSIGLLFLMVGVSNWLNGSDAGFWVPAAIRRPIVVPLGTPEVVATAVPSPPAKHTRDARYRSSRIDIWTAAVVTEAVPVQTPLQYIAMHIIQTKGIRFLMTHRMSYSATVTATPCVIAKA